MTVRPVTLADGTRFATLSAAVAALVRQGMNPRAIAAATGGSVSSITSLTAQLRKRALLPPAGDKFAASWFGRAESTIWLREATLRKFRAEAQRRCIRADQLMGQCLDIIIDDRLFDALLGPYVPVPVKVRKPRRAGLGRPATAVRDWWEDGEPSSPSLPRGGREEAGAGP